MPVIAVINRKGGSGKSTIAAHLAAWLAHQSGTAVMLGDVDRQQSTKVWLKRRDPALPKILPWATEQTHVVKVPTGISHVVLDTPGGIHGYDLSRVIMAADAIIMPVCGSIFDRESAATCYQELMSNPRIASGRCQLAAVGMRIDARTHNERTLREWAQQHNIPLLGVLREAQIYIKCIENGQTLFDLAANTNPTDLQQWSPITEWARPLMRLPQVTTPATAAPINPPAPATAALTSVAAVTRASTFGVPHPDEFTLPTMGTVTPTSAVPAFLLRH